MRALVVHPGPAFSVADVARGWSKGLTDNGVDVVDFNLDDRLTFYAQAHLKKGRRWVKAFDKQAAARMAAKGLEVACYEWWPDLVIVVSGFFIPVDLLDIVRSRRHKVVYLHTESPYEDDRQLVRAGHADLNILNDPTNLERFQQEAPTVYIPHGYDPDIHRPHPVDPDLASDFAFVGTGYQSRIDFFESVDWTGIDATFAGNWQQTTDISPLRPLLAHPVGECCPNDETVRLYASTKASANLYRIEATQPALSAGWAMGPREVELAACGVFFLRDPRPESDAVLPMLPTFCDPADFGDKLRWWLAHDEQRHEAAVKAREAVADRTFANHAAQLLQLAGL